ncbi:hypothetical protein [Absidia glauca]|uniref:Uncharacterized protein n=1 Tax=Absidia glauca TaxID=4829 RepID=A0A163M8U1_ABSGL|nr:hypothetical protein [Absidia glauca]
MPRSTSTKKKTIKKDTSPDLTEDMDTDDLLDISDTLLSTTQEDHDKAEKSIDQDIDDLLDSTEASSTTPKKKGRVTKKKTDGEATTTKGRKKAATTTPKAKAATTPKGKAASKGKGKGKAKTEEVEDKLGYELQRTKELADQYPDNFWQYHADSDYDMIGPINMQNQLDVLPYNISDQGAITGMTLSHDGQLLATFSSMGSIRIWDINNEMRMIRKLRDGTERQIEEFYCGLFLKDAPELLVAGGKLKDRQRWSSEDNDNHITPSPIKIFNMETGKVIASLHGHDEEILSIKALRFNGENHYISTSQDGHIIKWRMADDWTTLVEMKKMEEEETCMAFNVSFVPNTGNKYFIAACDEVIRLYDFEHGKLFQSFDYLYSSYCDCAKFINWLDEPLYWEGLNDAKKVKAAKNEQYAWIITRGAELCDEETGVEAHHWFTLATTPNTCGLHRLVYPKKEGDLFVLEEIKRYSDKGYHANSWLVKVSSNGRYLLAPTIHGQIFVFNLLSGQLTAILKNHEDMEIRDVMFHPYAPLMFSSSDDGSVRAYTYKESDDQTEPEQDDKMHEDLGVGTA